MGLALASKARSGRFITSNSRFATGLGDETMGRSPATTTALGLVLLTITTSGCFWGLPTQGPSLGILAVPIPISPYFQDQKEDRAWEKERYERVPILGPIRSGGPPVAIDPPSDDEV